MIGTAPTLHHVGIVVEDIAASAEWYARHLGFEEESSYGFPGVKVTFIRRGSLRLELFQNEAAAPMAEERSLAQTNLKIGGINHFAIAVDDLDGTVTTLRDAGVAIVSEPRAVPNGSGDRFAFVHDNERMLVELFEQAR